MGVSATVSLTDRDEVAFWRARAERAEERAERAEAQVEQLRAEVTELRELVTTLQGLLFGASSEKSPGRGGLDGEDGHEDGPAPDPDGPATKRGRGQRRGGRGHGRRDYSHLETETRVITLDPDDRCCGSCGAVFELFGYEDSEQLDWVVKLVRIVYRRSRYRRTCSCGGPATVCAPPAPKPVRKGLFTAGFLARLAHEKFVLGRPVHRIVKALAAEGADLAPGSLTGALRQVGVLLAPWAAAIAGHARTAGHVHADETSWQVFEEVPGKDSSRWWLWTFVSQDAAVFVIDPTRSADVPARHLGIDRDADALADGRHLVISSDFHRAYQSLALIDGIDPLWCWAHMRRYFLRAAAAHPDALTEWKDGWIARIAVAYRAHHALAATIPGTDAHAASSSRLQRVFADLDAHRKLQTGHATQGLLHPAAAKVIATLNNEWDGLARHQHLPHLPLDNNEAERSLRTPVVDRKNFYGSGAVWAANLAADTWTITATLARNGIEPLPALIDYLTWVADRSGTAPTGNDLDAFLPWTTQSQAKRAPAGPAP